MAAPSAPSTTPQAAPFVAGHLADNVAGFTALLRRSGMALGFESAARAAQALSVVDLRDRRQAKAALSAALLHHRKDRALFDAAFAVFWRAPVSGFTAEAEADDDDPASSGNNADDTALPKALEDALRANTPDVIDEVARAAEPDTDEAGVEVQLQATEATSEERLRALDFAAMTAEEQSEAQALIHRFTPILKPRPTRRFRPAGASGRIDLAASLKGMPRTAGELQRLVYRKPQRRPDPLVILADVSGSMDAYTRPTLIFAHALAQRMVCPVETFVFATRLTPITRDLRRRDPDRALGAAVARVQDWSGGTRLGEIIGTFNRQHLRRVLSSGGTCLLITDGLERGNTARLEAEVRRLSRFSRLWWLNPLMRYEDYSPSARGAAVLERYAERRVSVHSLDSLAAIGEALRDLG